jgi:hypothetical protein
MIATATAPPKYDPVEQAALTLIKEHGTYAAEIEAAKGMQGYAHRSKAKGYLRARDVYLAVLDINRKAKAIEVDRQRRLAEVQERRVALASKLVAACNSDQDLIRIVLDAGKRLEALIDAEAAGLYAQKRYGKMYEAYARSEALGLLLVQVEYWETPQ